MHTIKKRGNCLAVSILACCYFSPIASLVIYQYKLESSASESVAIRITSLAGVSGLYYGELLFQTESERLIPVTCFAQLETERSSSNVLENAGHFVDNQIGG